MAAEFLKLTKLTIYVGEDFFYKDKPFYKAIFDIAAKYKIVGCTVLRGTQGYGSRVRGKERRLFISVSEAINLPVIVTMVDTEAQISQLYSFLDENLRHGVATVEPIQMLKTQFVRQEYEKKSLTGIHPWRRIDRGTCGDRKLYPGSYQSEGPLCTADC